MVGQSAAAKVGPGMRSRPDKGSAPASGDPGNPVSATSDLPGVQPVKNDYAAACWRCGKMVPPGEGFVSGKPKDWHVTHKSCIPEYRPWIKGLEYDL